MYFSVLFMYIRFSRSTRLLYSGNMYSIYMFLQYYMHSDLNDYLHHSVLPVMKILMTDKPHLYPEILRIDAGLVGPMRMRMDIY